MWGGADVSLSAQAEGDGVLAGFGSADPKPLTGYCQGACRTFHGRAQAILRRNPGRGPLRLTVQAEGYPPVQVDV